MSQQRPRDAGISPGSLPTGKNNAITDVSGVLVGHLTLREGRDVRTGVTAVLPHGGNVYQDRVPAALAVANGFGKLAGATQLQELGELETPILLTNTLAVPAAAAALISWTLDQPGNEDLRTVNPLVGETNDGYLNDMRQRALSEAHARHALEAARSGPVVEGAAGAGAGTICCGWKGGIGTSSRRLRVAGQAYTLGALVQSNFGGRLQIMGVPLDDLPGRLRAQDGAGSIMIIIATDAPLSDRNLRRLAWRAFAGLARTGASFANGSGDYALAFSTAPGVRRTAERRRGLSWLGELPNELLSPLFAAVIEAVEEAVYNSLWAAEAMTGYRGQAVAALPIEQVLRRLRESGQLY